MSTKETKRQEEDVVDAKNAVATVAEANVSTTVEARGVALHFPFIRVAQGLSQWRVDGRKGEEGALYIGLDKTNNVKVGDPGAQGGVEAILLAVVPGLVEERKFDGATPPRRWTGPNFMEDAAKEGFSLAPVATGEVWTDSGRPIMRANASKFCYLQLLVPAPDGLDESQYQLFPIGERLYTPARVEFSKVAFKNLDATIGNLERVERFRHRAEKDYKFSWTGKICRVYTVEVESKMSKGTLYPTLRFGLVNRAFTDAEKADFESFLMSVSSAPVDVAEVSNDIDVG